MTLEASSSSSSSSSLDVQTFDLMSFDVALMSPAPPPPCAECQRPMAHECLGEVLRVLRQVINTYPLLNTVEILTAAGKLISKVKGQLGFAEALRLDLRDFLLVSHLHPPVLFLRVPL